jgi:hypothetical protein
MSVNETASQLTTSHDIWQCDIPLVTVYTIPLADLGGYVNRIPGSAADIVHALHSYMPSCEAGFVFVPIGLGPDPDDLLHAALAMMLQVLAHQADAPGVHKEPGRRMRSDRLQEAGPMHHAVVGRREVFVWTGFYFDTDNV